MPRPAGYRSLAVWTVTADPPLLRKTLIYRSGLGFHCINHVLGCSHGCRYPCHAFLLAQRHGRIADYSAWCRPRVVENATELLAKELRGRRKPLSEVHLCLSTDPFMVGRPEVGELSLALIEELNRCGVSASILTKGVLPEALADAHRFPCPNTCGTSLVSLDEGFRRRWEPGASPYGERIEALRRLHHLGCRTRVHIEPYPTPNLVSQRIETLLAAVDFVDAVFFGGWNYNRSIYGCPNPQAFYREQAAVVERICAQRGIAYETAVTT